MESNAQHVTINLSGGPIKALSDGSLIRARGIRYATAARFHRPEPFISWQTPQDCTKPAPICPQNPSRLNAVNGHLEKGRETSEDCLRVTVIAPKGAKDAPVMVFIHGGAWLSGVGDLDAYSPHKLARKGVVAVNVTYRLGIFGYLPIPGVAPANLGLLDQLEALKWVQRNISAFGGDPGKVTVYGQSAGGDSVHCLCVSDESRGLFHRAIAQSAPTLIKEDENLEAIWRAMSEHAATIITPDNAASLPVSRLLALTGELIGVARSVAPGILSFSPLLGHDPLPPANKALERLISATREKQLLFGWTGNEDTAFVTFDSRPAAGTLLLDMFQRATEDLIQTLGKETGSKPGSFVVSWYPEGSALGATHCIDLPLILGDWDAWKDAPMLQGPGAQESLEAVGNAVQNLWVSFARGADLSGQRFLIDKNFSYNL